jgi:hypothetical protein
VIVVDDVLLFDVLAGIETAEFQLLAADGIASTSSWYYRLARALPTGRVDGALSRRFAVLSDVRRNHIRGLFDDLPDRIELVRQRFLVPPMSALGSVMLVNLLNAEAVATALILDASIVVTTDSALLGRAAGVASIDVTIIREP